MIKTLHTLILLSICSVLHSQNLLTENFETFPTPNWISNNQSVPLGLTTWQQGAMNSSFNTGAFNGTPASFVVVNYNSISGAGTISNWYISPVVSLKDGDIIRFYTREGGNFNNIPDRLELRISTNGASSVIPSTGNSDLGSFTTLVLSVNPTLLAGVYPVTWTQYAYTVTGISTATDCKIAFRYYVTNGGPTGSNGNVIGLDAVTVDRPLSTDSFFKSNFSMFPNPVSDVLNIVNTSNININTAEITDVNGRVVKEVTGEVNQINISTLTSGIYFLKINTDEGTGTTKIVKK